MNLTKQQKNIIYGAELFLLTLSALACVKCLILGLRNDEEYAVTMAYRIAVGDRMFLDIWDPHQTSGFLCAALIRLFLFFSSGPDYLVLYLRLTGILLQGAVSLFAYTTFKKKYPQPLAFLCGLLCFTLLPKWILVPEFSNILFWGSLCTMLCFFRISYGSCHPYCLLVSAGLFSCCAVLAYPTWILTVLVYTLSFFILWKPNAWKYIGCYLGTCLAVGIGYILYFCLRLSPAGLLEGIKHMSMDGSHRITLKEQLYLYAREISEAMLPFLLYLLVAAAVVYFLLYLFLLRGARRSARPMTFLLLLFLFSLIQQMLIWLGNSSYFNEPYLFFFVSFLLGGFLLKRDRAMTWLGFWPACSTLLAALLLTNTGIRVTGAYLLPGILAVLLTLHEALPHKPDMAAAVLRPLYGLSLFAFAGLLLFAKGFLVNENAGYKTTVFYVKQKALTGPAKNIYCRYTDGYLYNIVAELAPQYIGEGETVLCLTDHSLWYLLTGGNISNYSTISTPTFDERLLEYWELHPERYPDIVVASSFPGSNEILRFLRLEVPIAEQEGISIYRVECPLDALLE